MVIVTMTGDQTDYIKYITVVVIVKMTDGHCYNDQTDYIKQMTVVVIVIMTGGQSNNDQIDFIKQINNDQTDYKTDDCYGHCYNDQTDYKIQMTIVVIVTMTKQTILNR